MAGFLPADGVDVTKQRPGKTDRVSGDRRRWPATVLLWALVAWIGCAGGPGTDPSSPPVVPQEAPDVPWVSQKPEFLEIAVRMDNTTNEAFGLLQIPDLERQLETPGNTPEQTIRIVNQLSAHRLRLGDIDGAVEEIEKSYALARSLPDLKPGLMRVVHRRRAMIYLRRGELANCIGQGKSNCSTLPFEGESIHADPSSARRAWESLQATLASQPNDLLGIWLMNITAMALGEYPAGVPESYRIPTEAFESDYDIGRFPNVAPALGIDTLNLAGGAIIDDFDGDGLLDIVNSTMDTRGPLTYYRNRGDGGFEDLSAASRLDDQLGGLNCVGADYDGDGDFDIFVPRGAWLFDYGQMRNSLLRNNGDGTFTDVTRAAGVAEPPSPTQAVVWGDFDNDGDLDFFIGNESRIEWPEREGDYPSQLFLNNGNGTFTDVAAHAGVTNDRLAKGVTAGDYDNDGDLDLYVSNIGVNRLYRNNGDGTFTDVAQQLGVTEPEGRSFVPWFFDFDNDGHLDLYVGAYDALNVDTIADTLGLGFDASPPRLYHNDGNGGFTDVTKKMGLNHAWAPMGANFGDLDNDGYLDLYLTTGNPGYESLVPDVMLRNNRGRGFQDVTTSGGFGQLQKGHGVAFGDIDNDGDQDIYHQVGGMFPGDRFHNALFLNPGHGNHYLTLMLEGAGLNRRGIGSRIRVVVDTADGPAEFHRAVGSVGSFGSSSTRQEIGLGNALGIERVEIRWPGSKTATVLTGVPIDTIIRVVEDRPGFETVKLPKIDLTGASSPDR